MGRYLKQSRLDLMRTSSNEVIAVAGSSDSCVPRRAVFDQGNAAPVGSHRTGSTLIHVFVSSLMKINQNSFLSLLSNMRTLEKFACSSLHRSLIVICSLLIRQRRFFPPS